MECEHKHDEVCSECCSHPSVQADGCGFSFCLQCGLEVDHSFTFKPEWRCYDHPSKNPTRCSQQNPKPKGIRPVFEFHQIKISSNIIDCVEAKFQKVVKSEGNKIVRGKCREAIIAACLLYTYQELDEYRTADYIRNLFNLNRRRMSEGITKYQIAFPEVRMNHITPEKLLVWMMKLAGVSNSHYPKILEMILEKKVEGCNAQSFTAAMIYHYICLNPELKMTKSEFSKKVGVSEMTIYNIMKTYF